MRIKISSNTIVFGLLLTVALVVLFKVNIPTPNKAGTQEISSNAVSTIQANIKVVSVVAKQYSFSPNPIKLKLNEPVRFRLTSKDVTHGFSVPELGIDETVTPGKETVFDFTPKVKGMFTLLCSIVCGPGHSGMRGQIIVY